jgi:FkbH-like protein
LNAGYFESVAFDKDDAIRAISYLENAKRAKVKAKSRDLSDYLASLNMKLELGSFDAASRARITQLINKTNQFNLVTRRLSEQEVEAMEKDTNILTLQARLSDSFGEMGLISVVTCMLDNKVADITDWLMSCRVLGRKVEEAIFDSLVKALAARGVDYLRASYIPSKKNNMVRDHFDKLQMEFVNEEDYGLRQYTMKISAYRPLALPISIVEDL